jgi:UDP-glucuronate 4-epimerase
VSSSGKQILLTGGAGFIGSHVAEALLRRGAQLTIIDNLDNFYSSDWKKANLADVSRAGCFEFHAVDICDLERLREVIARTRPDAIIHLAARAGVRPSIEHPHLYERVNIAGTLNLLDLSREFAVRKFLFASSSSVYGATSLAPFSESHFELRPISPYGATKLAGELLCYTYAHLYQIQTICLRFFTVYGPRQRPDLAIHKFVGLIERGQPVPVFGDASSGRDYTYVDDTVAGVLGALDFDLRGRDVKIPFEVFNLGNSNPVKLGELVALLERLTGRKVLREARPPQPGDVPLTWADISKSERLLGYRPAVRIEDGLGRFVEWYRTADPNRRARVQSAGRG